MGITIGIPVGVTMIMAMLVEDWLPEAFWEFVLMAPKVPWEKMKISSWNQNKTHSLARD